MDGDNKIQRNFEKSNINISIDIVRFIMALIVVSIHCNFFSQSSLQKTIWSFPVPFFAMTSGYFFRNADKNKLIKHIERMFFLILLGDVINYTTMIYAQYKAGYIYMNWRYFFLENITLGHLWYLFGIIICSILFFFVFYKMDNKYIKICIFISCVLLNFYIKYS